MSMGCGCHCEKCGRETTELNSFECAEVGEVYLCRRCSPKEWRDKHPKKVSK